MEKQEESSKVEDKETTKELSSINNEPIINFEKPTEFVPCYVIEEENVSNSNNCEENDLETKVNSKNFAETSNEAGFEFKKKNAENVHTSFLSRDEAIKLSTNASGTSQPRLSTKAGSNLLIKHGETDSTCKEERTDKIRDKNVEKVSSATTINTQDFEPEESDQGLKTISTPRHNECQNLSAKPAVIPTFGSKDPVVKKMVYNQYREMLRKYTQSSRL